MPPFDIQVLLPSMRTCELPSGVAVVAIAATSEPASGSDSANAAISLPSRTGGRYRALSSAAP